MEVLRRSSVFAAEVLDVFDRSLTEKELVSQSKALCRDYILSRLNQNGLGWSKTELNLSPSNAALTEVSLVLLCLGKRNLNKHLICTLKAMVVISFSALSLIYSGEHSPNPQVRWSGHITVLLFEVVIY